MAKLSVQLVTWNGAKYVPYLFASLRQQTYTDWELSVLDNASSDATAELIQKELTSFPVRYSCIVSKENTGFAGGHNRLFKQGNGEYILLLNQDMSLAPDCLEKLATFLDAHADVAAVTPRLMKWEFDRAENEFEQSLSGTIDSLGLRVFRNRRIIEQYTSEQWSALAQKLGTNLPVFGVSGAMPVYRRSALEHIAFSDGTFFDESYFSYKEDVDVAFRLRSAGFEAAAVLDAVAWHDRSAAGPKELSDKAAAKNKKTQSSWVRYHSYKNHLATLYKNEYWQNCILDFPWIVWYELKKFCYYCYADRAVLRGSAELWKNRKNLKDKKQHIINRRAVSWKQVRLWWE